MTQCTCLVKRGAGQSGDKINGQILATGDLFSAGQGFHLMWVPGLVDVMAALPASIFSTGIGAVVEQAFDDDRIACDHRHGHDIAAAR